MIRNRVILGILLVINAMMAYSQRPTPYIGCANGTESAPASNATMERDVFYLVNVQRKDNGNLPPYKRLDTLNKSARYHATDMAGDDYFDHRTFDRIGGVLDTNICNTLGRIKAFYGNHSNIGENILWGSPSAAGAITAWMGSPLHRGNILGNYREIGVGYHSFENHYVKNFGAWSIVYPLVINSDSESTNNLSVRLYLYGSPAVFDSIRFQVNGGTFSNWMSFENRLNWVLENRIGDQTITAEMMKNGIVNSSSIDDIILTAPTSIEKESSIFATTLYPNPVQNQLNISLILNQTTDFKIHLYNAIGQKMFSFNETANAGYYHKIVNTTDLNNGIYYLIIESSDAIISHTIYKK